MTRYARRQALLQGRGDANAPSQRETLQVEIDHLRLVGVTPVVGHRIADALSERLAEELRGGALPLADSTSTGLVLALPVQGAASLPERTGAACAALIATKVLS